MEEDNDENIYERLIDILINNQPLTTSRIDEFSDAIRINQQITNNISNIRRSLESNDYNNFNNVINIMFDNVFNYTENITHNTLNNQHSYDNQLNNILNNYNQSINDNETCNETYNETYNEIEIDYNEINDEINYEINDETYNQINYETYNQIEDVIEDQLVNENTNINELTNELFNELFNHTNTNYYSRSNNSNDNNNLEFLTESSMLNRIMQVFLDPSVIDIDSNINMEDVKVILTKDQFKKLDSKIILEENLNDYSNKECNICMDEYKIGDKIIILDCKHIFHRRCIKHWLLQEKVTCPVCRKDVREMIK